MESVTVATEQEKLGTLSIDYLLASYATEESAKGVFFLNGDKWLPLWPLLEWERDQRTRSGKELPTAVPSGPEAVKTQYFVMVEDESRGPYTIMQLRTMWASGALTGQMAYWKTGMEDWLPLESMMNELENSRGTSQPGENEDDDDEPPTGLFCGLTIIFPLVGLVAGIVWACSPRPSYRAASAALIVLSLVMMFAGAILIAVLRAV
jgi:hypothetical protein